MGVSKRTEVSYAQQRGTFLRVYPPPPRTSVGTLNDFTQLTHSAWPFRDRLKQPNRSPTKFDFGREKKIEREGKIERNRKKQMQKREEDRERDIERQRERERVVERKREREIEIKSE